MLAVAGITDDQNGGADGDGDDANSSTFTPTADGIVSGKGNARHINADHFSGDSEEEEEEKKKKEAAEMAAAIDSAARKRITRSASTLNADLRAKTSVRLV